MTVEEMLDFNSSSNMVREVNNFLSNFKQIAW